MPSLLRSARDGDDAALDTLLRTLVPRVRRWLNRLLGPRGSLDDATQEVLIALSTALPRFEGSSALDTYCYRITLRVAFRHLKRERRRPPLTLVPTGINEIDPESKAISREAVERLYAALDELEPDGRVAFVLCAIEGLSARDAAEACGVSAATMRVRVHRARKALRRRLETDPLMPAAAKSRRGRKTQPGDGGPT